MNVSQIHPAHEVLRVRRNFEKLAKTGGTAPVERKILRKNGQVIDVEIRPTILEIGGRKVVQGIFIDLTERRRIEAVRLVEEKKQRDALVREVHHRIKNNLHGITSVLRQFAEEHPEVTEPLNYAISQVQGVAVIHGLQGRTSLGTVRICELTTAIAAGIESLWEKTILVEIPTGWIPCTIAETEAVPLALVLNEIISNAVKHGTKGLPVHIAFRHEPRPDCIQISIFNNGSISAELGQAEPHAFGTGLDLVASLLPQSGAKLSWHQRGETVLTLLELEPPVVLLESPP